MPRRNRIAFEHRERIVRAFEDVNEDYLLFTEHTHETGHYPIWNEVKFIDRDPHWNTRRVKDAIHIRLYPNNINRDSGIEIPEA